ncbi:MAG: hypothetical protein WA919_02795 [Coleofasciculaceae cyanobacterium]
MWQRVTYGLSAALMGAMIVVVQQQRTTAQIDEQAIALPTAFFPSPLVLSLSVQMETP